MIRKLSLAILCCIISLSTTAQKKQAFSHVEPPFWWVGMKNREVEVMFHHATLSIAEYVPSFSYAGATLKEFNKVENPHFLFLKIELATECQPGIIPIQFRSGKKIINYSYELKQKSSNEKRIQGFDASDVIYLIMPDRFANGDQSNDSIPGFYEGVNRLRDGARHGGDLKGISDHLDYLTDLGVTALWLNPVLENNQRAASYHGYAITDLYAVDKRFGSNADYLAFIEKCHAMNLKVIQDMVMNHIGNEHWLMKDVPEKGWIHQFPEFTRSNYRSTVRTDPYSSKADVMKMNDGWFDTTMPDLDQTSPRLATYLIQNTLWWIEYAGIDGIRMDTYPYPDKNFMARWAEEVKNEYPKFNIVGEVWINDVATTAYWQHGSNNRDGYRSHLPSVTDFPLFFTIPAALKETGGWDTGLTKLYNLLSNDFIYPNANVNVIFLDNHDVSRFFLMAGKDLSVFKMGIAFLLTTRGVPQLYYGTELLMDGDGGHHPNVRKDFPGGWKDDSQNAFTQGGRTQQQQEAYEYIRKILNWRKKEPVIHNGKLSHYIPEDNIYVYFRHDPSKTVMVILNGNDTKKVLDTPRFGQHLNGASAATDVISGKVYSDIFKIELDPKSALILELK